MFKESSVWNSEDDLKIIWRLNFLSMLSRKLDSFVIR